MLCNGNLFAMKSLDERYVTVLSGSVSFHTVCRMCVIISSYGNEKRYEPSRLHGIVGVTSYMKAWWVWYCTCINSTYTSANQNDRLNLQAAMSRQIACLGMNSFTCSYVDTKWNHLQSVHVVGEIKADASSFVTTDNN